MLSTCRDLYITTGTTTLLLGPLHCYWDLHIVTGTSILLLGPLHFYWDLYIATGTSTFLLGPLHCYWDHSTLLLGPLHCYWDLYIVTGTTLHCYWDLYIATGTSTLLLGPLHCYWDLYIATGTSTLLLGPLYIAPGTSTLLLGPLHCYWDHSTVEPLFVGLKESYFFFLSLQIGYSCVQRVCVFGTGHLCHWMPVRPVLCHVSRAFRIWVSITQLSVVRATTPFTLHVGNGCECEVCILFSFVKDLEERTWLLLRMHML